MMTDNKYKILIISTTFLQVLEPYYSNLEKSGYEVAADPKWIDTGLDVELFKEFLPEIDAMITVGQPITENLLKIANKLKIISLACSGYEHLDLPLLTKFGVTVTNTPILEMAVPVADLAFGFMLSLASASIC